MGTFSYPNQLIVLLSIFVAHILVDSVCYDSVDCS